MQKIKNFFHLINAYFANLYYGFPSRKLKVIGVTGTDGKTTTTSLIYHILTKNNKCTSMISTIYANIGGQAFDTGLHTTTPSPWMVQKFLKKAADAKCEYFILETTSHAIDQNRIWGINYFVSILTNVTHEHLDYHKTYDNYLETKARIFDRSENGVINIDDESYEKVNEICQKYQVKVATYGLKKKANYNWQKSIQTKLLGDINRYNVISAFAVCKILGLSDSEIKNSISTFASPKGRMELAYNKDFRVIVDFAHTPNAIYHALSTVRSEYLNGKGRLIHVFGAAGKRDELKRPLMGEASGRFSDMVIITEEDHRSERVEVITEQISHGLLKMGFRYIMPQIFKTSTDDKVYTAVADREKAIFLGISAARRHDVVVMTGKAHEKSLCRGDKECDWDEFNTVKRAIKARLKNI